MKNAHRLSPSLLFLCAALATGASRALAQSQASVVAERPGHFVVPALAGAGNIVLEAGAGLQDDESVRNRARTIVTTLSIQKCLLENALETERAKRPTGPARSRR